MSKYIVDIDDFEPMFKVDSIGVFGIGESVIDSTENHSWSRIKSLEDFEELNSDYINEHFGDLQDEAYKRGLEEGKKATWELVAEASNAEYQKGLNDAWECAKKMTWTAKYGGYGERLSDVFGRTDSFDFYDYTPNEAIAKLKAFEQKQGEINVGDEVDWDGDRFVVTRIFKPYDKAEECDGVDMDGCTYHDVLVSVLTKTGRHFDIEKILEAMKA